MGLRIVNGKPAPITPYKGSWAEQQDRLRKQREVSRGKR